MLGALRFAFLFGFAVALAGCASIPEVPYDHTTANVHTIGVPTPSYPSGPSVVLASTVGQSLGLIGALADASMQANRDSKFQDILSQQKYSLPDQFSKDLETALTQHGYAVVPISIDRKDSGLLKDMPAAPQPVDAYLDVVVWSYGYIAAGIGQDTPYRPFVSVQCKLIKASDRSVLMQDVIVLNAVNPTPQNKQITLTPNPTFQFADFDSLTTQPDKATEGLRKSVTQVTTSLGNLLQ
jgi:hypothetical protein